MKRAMAWMLPGPGRLAAAGLPVPCADRKGRKAFCRPRGRPWERRDALARFSVLIPVLAFVPARAPLSAEDGAAPPQPAAREPIPHGTALPLLGRDVVGPSGMVVAQIVNVLVDGAGRPVAAVLDYGGFMGVGRRRIAVAWGALRFAPGEGRDGARDGTITLGLTRDQLKDFPDAKRGEPIVAAAPK